MYGYIDVYGGSILYVFIIFVITFIVVSYSLVIQDMDSLAQDWENNRCKPYVMPFAGLIVNNPNTGRIQYTAENFSECTKSIFSEIVNSLLQPIIFILKSVFSLIRNLFQSINMIRDKLFRVIGQIIDISRQIMNQVLVTLIPVQFLIIKILDTFRKTQGVLATQIYILVTAYNALRKFIVVIRDGSLRLLGIISGIMVPLFVFVFTIPFSVPFGIAYGIIAGFLGTLVALTTRILNLTMINIPPEPTPGGCFKKNTIIKKRDGTSCAIMNIKVGDILEDGSIVTETFMVRAKHINMYRYKNVIVSGDHRVCFRNNTYTPVRHLPGAVLLQHFDDTFIYCLNTTTKFIPINGILFVDWDDLDDKEYRHIQRQFHRETKHSIMRENIHRYMSAGFTEDTPIELENGKEVPIKNIYIGDILKGGHKVFAKVQLYDKDIDIVENELHGKLFHTTGNTMIKIKDNHYCMNTLKTRRYIERFDREIYHLVTYSGKFFVHNIPFADYNSCTEKYLQNYKGKDMV